MRLCRVKGVQIFNQHDGHQSKTFSMRWFLLFAEDRASHQGAGLTGRAKHIDRPFPTLGGMLAPTSDVRAASA